MSQLTLFIFKDRFKFSAAHMTFFPDGSKEALHGHNYSVGLRVGLPPEEKHPMIPFSFFKEMLQSICEQWDEKILLPKRNSFCKVEEKDGSHFVVACGKKYQFPSDEVVLLDVDNTTSENLARLFADHFKAELEKNKFLKIIESLEIEIKETDGQGCLFRWDNDGK